MRLIVRSSSWLNDTLFLLTALNSLTGMLTSPKLIVPLQIGRGMAPFFPESCARETAVAGQARLGSVSREHRPGHQVGAEGGEDGQVEQAGGGHHRRVLPLLQRRPGHEEPAPAW